MLKFSTANTKLQKLYDVPSVLKQLNDRKIYSFDLLSGKCCPGAKECKSQVKVTDGKRSVVDGPFTKFRCFSASQEALYTGVYNRRNENTSTIKELVKTPKLLIAAIHSALPDNAGTVRIHVAGDFLNYTYFKAWCAVAKLNPTIIFYAYSKSLPFWLKARDAGILPDNLRLTASRGGRYDHLIDAEGLREARVVFSKKEAKKLNLELDSNDYHAWRKLDKSFGLLLHGIMPKNSEASKAMEAIKKNARLQKSTK